MLEVVVFRLLSVVDSWGDPATGVFSVRVSLVRTVPSSRKVAGARGVCTSEAPHGRLTVNLGMRTDQESRDGQVRPRVGKLEVSPFLHPETVTVRVMNCTCHELYHEFMTQ